MTICFSSYCFLKALHHLTCFIVDRTLKISLFLTQPSTGQILDILFVGSTRAMKVSQNQLKARENFNIAANRYYLFSGALRHSKIILLID